MTWGKGGVLGDGLRGGQPYATRSEIPDPDPIPEAPVAPRRDQGDIGVRAQGEREEKVDMGVESR
eukprot:CAMPEP_0175047294 /NCGR_PEP_ID=MMETSP0052_2-20121109/5512_1 /TAXON_ID=51329 ORGANISM="Polytomella parva, Strain SAG 63-3" /NCGR_SAMPLE_ID=MMETSP0052_2 /ASSEMBLY_ACC=CAM_ASM_000194 /LENGTH=64 /DNA_ID=CAMNT_0016311147 /DNA_START=489 /DNA_END=680 /DNA_ORIENTATION=-